MSVHWVGTCAMTDRTVRTRLALTDVWCAAGVASGERLMVSAAQVHHRALLIICREHSWYESFDNCLLCYSDVNECQESNPCNQHCLNTIGSYRCACEPGFQLRNRRCIGEAATPPYKALSVLFSTKSLCLAFYMSALLERKIKTVTCPLLFSHHLRYKWVQTEGLSFRSAV